MSEDIREMIDKVKSIGKQLSENLENKTNKAKDIIQILNNNGIKVSKKQYYYDGSGYKEKYEIVDSVEVGGVTEYLGIPIKEKAQGFITKNGILQNFYYHNGKGFETTKNIDEFLKNISNSHEPLNENLNQEKSFKYIKVNENPRANMLIAITNGKDEIPDNGKYLKIINTETGEEISPCKKFTDKVNYQGTPNVLQTDVYHYFDDDWHRMDALVYPTKKWTWEYI